MTASRAGFGVVARRPNGAKEGRMKQQNVGLPQDAARARLRAAVKEMEAAADLVVTFEHDDRHGVLGDIGMALIYTERTLGALSE